MKTRLIFALGCLLLGAMPAWPQARVTGNATVRQTGKKVDNSGVVLWLTPVDGKVEVPAPQHPFRLAQRHKRFEPHLLVIPVGSVVNFPNLDPFFHNVFSLYDGRRFDLGLNESFSSRSIRFNRAGVSFIFCNIHPQMSAVVITMQTPWYAVTGPDGAFAFANIPPGRYQLHVWYERSTAELLAKSSREVAIDHDAQLDPVVVQTSNLPTTHKNKYGLDYDVNSGSSGPYSAQP